MKDYSNSKGITTLVIILLILLAFFVLGVIYYFGVINTKPLIKVQPSPVSSPTSPSTMVEYKSEPTDKIPNTIRDVFDLINIGLSTSIVSTLEDKFYTTAGYIDQKSWNLDLTNVIKDKSQNVIINNVLDQQLTKDDTKSADGAGQSVSAYSDENYICYLLLGIDSKSILSCSTK